MYTKKYIVMIHREALSVEVGDGGEMSVMSVKAAAVLLNTINYSKELLPRNSLQGYIQHRTAQSSISCSDKQFY